MTIHPPKGLRGFLIDAPEPGRLRGVRDGAVLIEDGVIAAAGPFDEVRRAPGAERVKWLHSPEAVIVPGLVDLHAHLPQYPVVARPDDTLLPAMPREVVPIERQFNAAAAREFAPLFFEALARNGTTCAALYATIYEDSCDAAFDAAERSGMRVILGKVMMDADGFGDLRPEKSAAVSLERSERLCRKWHGRDGGRLEYAFTPRSLATCSQELLREAALMARKFDAYLQTHLAESAHELEVLRARFPSQRGAVDVFEAMEVLGPRALFAGGIRLDAEAARRLGAAGATVVHCPTSNLFLNHGIAPLDRLQEAGVRLALGSDVGGGPELSLWSVMRGAIEAQKARAFYEKASVPTPATLFHLATRGAAIALGKDRLLGTLDVGKDADLVAIDLASALPYRGRGNMHSDLSAEEVITLLVYRGGPANVIETFVRGTSVYRAPAPGLF